MDDTWEKDHEAYVEALANYKETRRALEQAIGVQKDFEQTSWTAAEAVDDLRVNQTISDSLS